MSAADIHRIDGIDRDISEPLYCQRCGEVIGVYEPLVVANSSQARITSRAAEPALPADGSYCHHSCLSAADVAVGAA
jgi:hypothetical protein